MPSQNSLIERIFMSKRIHVVNIPIIVFLTLLCLPMEASDISSSTPDIDFNNGKVVTGDNVHEIFSYEKIDIRLVQKKANDLWNDHQLGIFEDEDQVLGKDRNLLAKLEFRIIDAWESVAMAIEWFKIANDDHSQYEDMGIGIWKSGEGNGGWFMNPHPISPDILSHFNFGTLEMPGVIRSHCDKYDFSKWVIFHKNSLRNANTLAILRNLQIEGLALNLIYITYKNGTLEKMLDDGTIGDIDFLSINVSRSLLKTYETWTRNPYKATRYLIPMVGVRGVWPYRRN